MMNTPFLRLTWISLWTYNYFNLFSQSASRKQRLIQLRWALASNMFVSDPNKDYEEWVGKMWLFCYPGRVWMTIVTGSVNLPDFDTNGFVFMWELVIKILLHCLNLVQMKIKEITYSIYQSKKALPVSVIFSAELKWSLMYYCELCWVLPRICVSLVSHGVIFIESSCFQSYRYKWSQALSVCLLIPLRRNRPYVCCIYLQICV